MSQWEKTMHDKFHAARNDAERARECFIKNLTAKQYHAYSRFNRVPKSPKHVARYQNMIEFQNQASALKARYLIRKRLERFAQLRIERRVK